MSDDLLNLTKRIAVLRGGPGSGNWGHVGRPGKRGGSSGGGGLTAIGAKPGSSHEERKKASQKTKQERRKEQLSSMSVNELNQRFAGAKNHKERVEIAEAILGNRFADNTIAKSPSEIPKTNIMRPSPHRIATEGKNAIFRTRRGAIEFGKVLQDSEGDYYNGNFGRVETVTPLFKAILQTKAVLTYKSGSHTGAMIALFMPREYTGIYTLHHYENALPPDELHITLAYLGKTDDLTGAQKNFLHDLMELVSENHPPLKGAINGVGRFCNGDEEGDPFFVIPDLPALPNLRELIVLALQGNDIEISKDHGFVPHITLGYFSHDDPNPFNQVERRKIVFPTISLVLGDSRYDYPLGGDMETKAALITRIGARHTSREFRLIQKMHDLACDLGAICKSHYHDKEEKAGAKHSRSDTKMIQRIHDDCVALGAECPVDKSKPPLPVPGRRDLMRKAQLDAPNYRPASTPRRCENCVFFKDDPGGDYCERFDFIADKDYVCDDWGAQNPDEIPGYQVTGQSEALSLAQTMKGIMTIRGR